MLIIIAEAMNKLREYKEVLITIGLCIVAVSILLIGLGGLLILPALIQEILR